MIMIGDDADGAVSHHCSQPAVPIAAMMEKKMTIMVVMVPLIDFSINHMTIAIMRNINGTSEPQSFLLASGKALFSITMPLR